MREQTRAREKFIRPAAIALSRSKVTSREIRNNTDVAIVPFGTKLGQRKYIYNTEEKEIRYRGWFYFMITRSYRRSKVTRKRPKA